MKQLEIKCAEAVQKRFLPELESVVHAILGPCPTGKNWLAYQVDASTHSPVILFPYPQAVSPGAYIPPVVKIEFGSLTDQRPTGTHIIAPLIAKLAPDAFTDFQAEVVALEIERTFWEKATILHAEYHRPTEKSLRDRFSRHYSDFAALWRHARGQAARRQLNLLERVRTHKSRFFASKSANYDTAKPGSFRLAPMESRLSELRRDYAAMEPMFLSPPPSFEQVLAILQEAEQNLNTT